MYKEFATTIITGESRTGKTEFIKNYIKELLREDVLIYLVDFKSYELYDFKNYDNVVYISDFGQFNDDLLFQILFDNHNIRKYIFVDEYEPIIYNKLIHSKISILLNNNSNNINLILSSRLENIFPNNFKEKSKTIIHFNKDKRRTYE